jgi:hypothetical protein
LTAAEKKEKRRQTGQRKKEQGAGLSAGIMAITDGYAICPVCPARARRTRLDKEMKEEPRQRAGRLDRICLKDKVDMVLAKSETPEADKWNKNDLKFMIQWFKWEGDKAMTKNKDGLLLRYRETCTRVVASVTYCDDNEEAIVNASTVAPVIHVVVSTVAPVGGATAAAVATAVAPTIVIWSLTRPPTVDAAQSPAAAAA